MDTSTAIQDVTKSVDQLCNQLTLSNIVVPRIDAYTDVFNFLNEFDVVTAALPEDKKKKLLVKAFPPGRLRSWFDDKLKSLVEGVGSWSTIKDKIVDRYSDTEERDRHFKRLSEMKFDPEGQQKLFDHVEDICYSFSKAFPKEKDDDTKIRYIRSVLPSAVKPALSAINEYSFAKNMDEFLRAIRRYDQINRGSPAEDTGKVKNSELVAVLKELIKGVRQEGESTRNVIAAMRNSAKEQSPRVTRRELHEYPRAYSPKRVPHSEGYQRTRERSASPYTGRQYPANPQRDQKTVEQSPNYVANKQQASANAPNDNQRSQQLVRAQSPSNYYRRNQTDMTRASDEPNKALNRVEMFDETYYKKKFGVPPRPCSNCQFMHWDRHCLLHLN